MSSRLLRLWLFVAAQRVAHRLAHAAKVPPGQYVMTVPRSWWIEAPRRGDPPRTARVGFVFYGDFVSIRVREVARLGTHVLLVEDAQGGGGSTYLFAAADELAGPPGAAEAP